MSSMIFRQLFHHETCTFTYLLAQPGADCLLIDPVDTEVETYLRLIDELSLSLVQAIDTHVHTDHVTALGVLNDARGCAAMMGEHSRAECLARRFCEGEEVGVGGISLKAIYTPGHTDDSYSLVLEQAGKPATLFTGDTLLIRGTGRTDFQNGDAHAQYDSLFNKLLTFPDDTRVYPAHDYKGWNTSTIGEEKAHNPRLQVGGVEEYAELMNNLQLSYPKMIDVAVPANLRGGRR